MQNTNRIFNKINEEKKHEAIQYGASYVGITIKTFIFLALLFVGAIGSYALLQSYPNIYVGVLIGAFITAFISVMVASFSPRLAGPFGMLYSLSEGVVLGLVTLVYSAAFPDFNIVGLAALITIGIFAGMLTLYSTKLIVVTSRFRRIMMGVSFGLLFSILIVSIVGMFDGGQLYYVLFGDVNSPLVLFISLLFIAYGAFVLVMHFDEARQIVSGGADKKYEWMVSLGLIVSTVYIFLQVLRLLAILLSRRD